MDEIIQQLKDYCDCFPELDVERPDEILELEKNVRELIQTVSSLTCWAKNTCETFLLSERTQYIDIDFDDVEWCGCSDAILEVCTAYAKVTPGSVEVTLIEREGLNKTQHLLELDEYSYDEDDETLRVNIGSYLSPCSCHKCSVKYTLKITYEAGYEEIPECLLGLFCDMLHVIYVKNDCNCERCQRCTQENNIDEFVEDNEYDQSGPKIRLFLTNLVVSAYKKQLGYMSICNRCADNYTFWGAVI